MKKVFSTIALVFLLIQLFGQITPQLRNQTIDQILAKLNDEYVFPEVARQMEVHVRQLQQNKAYDSITDGDALAIRLTADLRAIARDLHISVRYAAETLPPADTIDFNAPEPEEFVEFLKYNNYGINKLEVLKGNIGYIDFKFFCTPKLAGEIYSNALNYLSKTDALIIDLRGCSGSMSPHAVPFVCSYFFENPVHLNDLYWRKGNRTEQFYTYAVVPGERYLNKPIYVLTSGNTFSGAEEFAYDLQNLKRATIIGEITRGGANPGGSVRINDHFEMFIPIGRAINPITKTNWEGVGVQPDIAMPATAALSKAHILALESAIEKYRNEKKQELLIDILEEVQADAPKLQKVLFELADFADAKEVILTGSFKFWDPKGVPMKRMGNKWVVEIETDQTRIAYKFIVDGKWILDPANPHKVTEGKYENSLREVKLKP